MNNQIYNIDLNQLAKQIYKQNKTVGWWDEPNRCIYETLQLVSTEIAEATEGERKSLNDDHIPSRTTGEVELADTLIRLFDLGGRHQWHHDGYALSHRLLQRDKIKTIAGRHLVINVALTDLTIAIYDNYHLDQINKAYTCTIETVLKVADYAGYDVMSALHEKLIYNKTRTDHKRENRAKKNGKKF